MNKIVVIIRTLYPIWDRRIVQPDSSNKPYNTTKSAYLSNKQLRVRAVMNIR